MAFGCRVCFRLALGSIWVGVELGVGNGIEVGIGFGLEVGFEVGLTTWVGIGFEV